jgi:hypothetical protein
MTLRILKHGGIPRCLVGEIALNHYNVHVFFILAVTASISLRNRANSIIRVAILLFSRVLKVSKGKDETYEKLKGGKQTVI